MQILNHSDAWLSNYEVYQHLLRQKEKRDKLTASLKYPPRTAGNILTVEFETLQYLKGTDCAHLTDETLGKLMEYLTKFALTKAEKLQLVNQIPRSPIVEECEERFETEKIEEIIGEMQRIAALPAPMDEE